MSADEDGALIRLTPAAAEGLREMSRLLGIPADELASAWIVSEARDVLDSYRYYGSRVHSSRVRSWNPSGVPHLTVWVDPKESSPDPYPYNFDR